MTKKLSNDYRLWIESATPGTYNMIAGQQTLSINRAGGTIDTTTKDDYPYGSQAAGSRTVAIPYSLLPNLPDANGFTRLESLTNASVSTPFNIQIRKGGTTGNGTTDVVFQSSVYNTDFNTNLDGNTPVKATGTLVNAAAPTTDTLS
jgi:predicted secreted protein